MLEVVVIIKINTKPRARGNPRGVPSDQEILETLRIACRESIDLCWFYKLLLYTGLRGTEVEKALSSEGRWVEEDEIYIDPNSSIVDGE